MAFSKKIRFVICVGFAACIIALVISACKKDTNTVPTPCNDVNNTACPNYNSCYNKVAAKADFCIYEIINFTGIEADTVAAGKNCFLRSKHRQPGFTYNWTFSGALSGNYTDTVVNFTPPANNAGGFVTVTLIVKSNIGNCKTLKASDTLSKVFYIWPCSDLVPSCGSPTVNYLPIWGSYKGSYQSNPSLQVTVRLFDTVCYHTIQSLCYSNPSGAYDIVSGVPYLGASLQKIRRYVTHEVLLDYGASAVYLYIPHAIGRLDTTYHCNGETSTFPALSGIAWADLYNSKKLYINLQYIDTLTKQLKMDFFTGYKVP